MERIRGLRYEHIPRARQVTPAQAARAGLDDLDRSYPVARRRADEAMLELLRAVPPGTDLRREYGLEFRDQVGGYYAHGGAGDGGRPQRQRRASRRRARS